MLFCVRSNARPEESVPAGRRLNKPRATVGTVDRSGFLYSASRGPRSELSTQLAVRRTWRSTAMLRTIVLIVVVLLLIGALPTWPYSTEWGYYPGGGLGVVLVIVIILILLGRL
jgi:sterol desaturase/sphingolipid hydroxylase (fatty acid hydroxylase superfamily)